MWIVHIADAAHESLRTPTRRKLAVLILAALALGGCQRDIRESLDGIGVGQLQVLEDRSGAASLDDVVARLGDFTDVTVRTPNYRFTPSAFWFRLQVENRRASEAELFLDVRHPTLDYLQLHVVGASGRQGPVLSGDRIPYRERPFAKTTPVLPFRLAAGEQALLYLRVRADAATITVPLTVSDGPAMVASTAAENVLHGAMLGLFIALFIYNLLLFTLLRERTYLYYVAYLPFAYLSATSLNGFGSTLLYPGATWPGNEGLIFFSGISYALILAFTRSFLRTREQRGSDVLIKALFAVSLGLIAAPFLLPVATAYRIGTTMTFVFPVFSTIVGVSAWRRGKTEARFFVLGQAASWVGLFAFGLMTSGALPHHPLLFEGISIGIAADTLLLALALADRIRLLQNAKREAEEAARANLELRSEELERVVAQRTAELEEARRQAELLATIDPLTGAFNRRGLLELAARDLQLARRSGRSLSVILFDIDHFKCVNDAGGHAEGDRVLHSLATVVRSALRATDLFGRVGGEEFLIVLPETGEAAAADVAERLRCLVADGVSWGDPPEPITASFGVATTAGGRDDLDALQLRADAALYRAKDAGRNRVELEA